MLEFLTTKCIGYVVIMGTQTCTFNYLQWMLSEDFWHLSEDFGKFVRRFWEICGQIIPKIFVKEQLTHQCQNRCKLISMKIVTVEVNITCFICYCQRMAPWHYNKIAVTVIEAIDIFFRNICECKIFLKFLKM